MNKIIGSFYRYKSSSTKF